MKPLYELLKNSTRLEFLKKAAEMGIWVKIKQAWERPGTMKFWVGMVVFCNFSSGKWRSTLQSNLPYEVRKTVSSGMN